MTVNGFTRRDEGGSTGINVVVLESGPPVVGGLSRDEGRTGETSEGSRRFSVERCRIQRRVVNG